MTGNRRPNSESQIGMSRFSKARFIAAGFVLLIACNAVFAQEHTRRFGEYLLRSSTVSSENLSAQSARANGINRDPHRAVINVTVLKKSAGVDRTVPARVQVYAYDLAGRRRFIDVHEIAAEGRANYLGTYKFEHGEVLTFTISAKPAGSEKTFSMTYRDRLWARGDLPEPALQHQRR
jgi:hypothetical protein